MLSSASAPVLLIGGWTLAAARQPAGYDAVTDTISALAGHGAADRWLMTSALAGLGVCHAVTALGLRSAALPGRLVLAAGGVATVLVAAFPLPADGPAVAHTVAAGVAFTALAVWPALALGRAPRSPWGLRPAVSIPAAIGLLGLVGWFAVELGGTRTGAAERIAAGAQAVWPLLVVLSTRVRAPSTPGTSRG